MTYQQALKVAMDCVAFEIRRLTVDANLYDIYGADYPHAIQASKKRVALKQALDILRGKNGVNEK